MYDVRGLVADKLYNFISEQENFKWNITGLSEVHTEKGKLLNFKTTSICLATNVNQII